MPAFVSECAEEQGKFWDMHNFIFKNSKENIDGYIAFAKKINLDIDQFQISLKKDSIKHRIENNIKILKELGISITPTLIINNRIYYGQLTVNEIDQYIKQELSNKD